jgi:hypothetical protein
LVPVKPCGVVVAHPIDLDVVVVRGSLPGTIEVWELDRKYCFFTAVSGKYWFPSTTTQESLSAISFPAQNAFAMDSPVLGWMPAWYKSFAD